MVRLRRGRRRARNHTERHNHTSRVWSTILWYRSGVTMAVNWSSPMIRLHSNTTATWCRVRGEFFEIFLREKNSVETVTMTYGIVATFNILIYNLSSDWLCLMRCW